jgi:glycosyltransferase involved in cell wall biosynthesis
MGPHNPANIHYFNQLRALRNELELQGTVNFLAEITPEYLPDAVITDFYRLADGMILPSQEEGFGIPVLEAGISGLPVFCTDIPPLIYLAGENAVYFSPDGDPVQIAKQIHDHLSADKLYHMRIKTRTQFTWEGVYKGQIEPLLRDIRAI